MNEETWGNNEVFLTKLLSKNLPGSLIAEACSSGNFVILDNAREGAPEIFSTIHFSHFVSACQGIRLAEVHLER